MQDDIRRKAEKWTEPPFDDDTRAEIRNLLKNGENSELKDRFYKELEFGTGGMRGIMGAGSNRMNIYTIGKATQGLADYLLEALQADDVSVAVAFDSRNNSPRFAREAASVLAANGIRVYIYPDLRPTPLLSFTVRRLGCRSGIVITASHNPKEYNGYKVYGSDGAQVVTPEDARIVDFVNRVDISQGVKRVPYEEGVERGLIEELDESTELDYLNRVDEFIRTVENGMSGMLDDSSKETRVVYTPLHGTGGTLVPAALRRIANSTVLPEPEQSVPDGGFTTTPSPNPEDPAALTAAIDLARREGADLVIATDPDCDRMGLAVPGKEEGEYVTLSGNQTGCLLAYVLLMSYRKAGLIPEDGLIISTIVSTEMIHYIALDFGVEVFETLTGFKFICGKMREIEEKGTGAFLFGFEESYGYLGGTFVRDKDGVIGSALAVLMVRYACGLHGSVLGLLDHLYARYGVFDEFQRSFVFRGAEGAQKIVSIMKQLRDDPPAGLGGVPVLEIKDYLLRKRTNLATGEDRPLEELPESNVLQFVIGNGRISVRPSGTEPKIKFYFGLNTPAPVAGETAGTVREKLKKSCDAVSNDLYSICGLI